MFYGWPFATLLARGLSAHAVGDTLGRSLTWEITWFTLWQAVLSTVLTVVVGMAPAYVLARYRFAGRRTLGAVLTAVFVLPTVVMGAAVLAILPGPWERGVPAILVAHVLFNLAVVVRTVGAVWDHLPPDLEGAAATLGAPPWRVLIEVTLPLLRPAVLAAASIVFVFTFTSFGVIRVLGDAGTSTIEVEVWRQATQLGDIGAAATLAVLQLVLVGAAVAWSAWQQRRHGRTLALRPHASRRRPRPGGERRFVTAVVLLTGAVTVAPLVALVARSLRVSDGWSLAAWRHLGRAEVRPGIDLGVDPVAAIGVSLRTTVAATFIALAVGIVAALAITVARRAGRLLDTGLMLPIATSAVTIGFGVLITFDVRAGGLAGLVVDRAGRPSARRRAVRRARRAARDAQRRPPPPRGGGDARRVPDPGVVQHHPAVPAPTGRRCSRARRGDLPRRVRRHELPDPQRVADDADRRRAAPRSHRGAAAGPGLRAGGDPGRRDDRPRRRRRRRRRRAADMSEHVRPCWTSVT